MPRPKPDVKPVPIMVRVHPDTAAWIDEQRGEASRSEWVNGLVQRAMKQAVAAPAPVAITKNPTADSKSVTFTHTPDVQLGPAPLAPGSRLKKR